MSPYEERLQQDLEAIRVRVRNVAESVDRALRDSVHALLVRDEKLANETVLGDLPINRAIRALDARCHAFIARHLPSAGHLRFVSSVLRLTIELERIGDYAVTIAREASQLESELPELVRRDVELLADQSRRMLKQAVRAFDEGNADLARGTKGMADQVDASFRRVFADLTEAGDEHRLPTRELFALLSVFNSLERVSDQAKNVCEEVEFYVDGRRKPPKTYRVLFIDETGERIAPIAVAFARKAFPHSLATQALSCKPAGHIDAEIAAFLERNGHSVEDLAPRPVELTSEELAALHVVVGLDGDPGRCFEKKPFQTVFLEWPISKEAAQVAGEGGDEEALYRALSLRIRALAELLRGEEAD